MRAEQFHWWTFSRDIEDGDEIECPMCKTWTNTASGWIGRFGRCNGCSAGFMALVCPACEMGINHHHEVLRVRKPGEEPAVEEKTPERPPWARNKKGR